MIRFFCGITCLVLGTFKNGYDCEAYWMNNLFL